MSTASPAADLVHVKNLSRALGGDGETRERTVLHDISFSVGRGEFVALTGASGSGKSTLLYLLGALDRTSFGEVWIDGVELGSLDEEERSEFRNTKLGFVFQFHFLLPEFSALENIAIPMIRRGLSGNEAEDRAALTLARLGLEELGERKPGQLSGGEQQRVSIARAVANEPALILADEPTGNLDSENGEMVVEIFRSLAREQGRTVIMVTHDEHFATLADRRIVLKDGRLIQDGRPS